MAVKNYGIRDQWTNLDKLNNVDIKSVDGVIESVKINGEEAGGGGSSDFTTAVVTVNGVGGFVAIVPTLRDNGLFCNCIKSPLENSFTVVLYQGETIMECIRGETPAFTIPEGETNIVPDDENGWYVITGDCTITIS